MSVLVPPTSIVSRFGLLDVRARWTAPFTPPTGPETSWKTGAFEVSVTVPMPPFIVMIQSEPV
jgi:hypothetical protein